MSCLLQNQHLLHDFFTLIVVAEMRRVNRFDCDKLLSNYLQSDVDLTESALTQHFSDSIKFDRCWGTLIIRRHKFLNMVDNFTVLAVTGGYLRVYRFLSLYEPVRWLWRVRQQTPIRRRGMTLTHGVFWRSKYILRL